MEQVLNAFHCVFLYWYHLVSNSKSATLCARSIYMTKDSYGAISFQYLPSSKEFVSEDLSPGGLGGKHVQYFACCMSFEWFMF